MFSKGRFLKVFFYACLGLNVCLGSLAYADDPAICQYSPPTLVITPNSQSTSGSPVNYNVNITNNNVGCGIGLFRFSANSDDFFIKTFMEPYNILVLPGQTRISLLTMTPTAGAKKGAHTFSIVAQNADGKFTTAIGNLQLN
jgi:hypothetical protein